MKKKNFLRLALLWMAVQASVVTVQGETTDGNPGNPILLSYDELYANAANLPIPNDYYGYKREEMFPLATSKYQAAPISPALDDFLRNPTMAQGQIFYLEGGKT